MSDNFTLSEQETIKAVSGAAAGLSLLGSLLIIICIQYEKVDGYRRLLVWLSVSDIIMDVVVFLGLAIDTDNGCEIMGFLVTFADLPPVLWTACISSSLALSVFFLYKSGKKGNVYFWWYFAFSYGVPLVLAVSGSVAGIYGSSGYGMCWISDTTNRLLFFYVPLWVVIIFNTVVYCLITWEYKKVMRIHQGPLGSTTTSSKVYRFKYYPAVLVVAWFFGTLNRVLQEGGVNSFTLAVLQQLFGRSQGLLNAIVYGSDTLVPWLVSLKDGRKTEKEMEEMEESVAVEAPQRPPLRHAELGKSASPTTEDFVDISLAD